MPCVKVSARILRFPSVCCCCGSGCPQTWFRATATRTTGKKVIRTDSRSWDFPLCHKCESWMDLQHAANAAYRWFVAFIVFAVLGFLSGVLSLFGSLPILAGVVGMVTTMVSGLVSPFVYESWQRRQSEANRQKPADHCRLHPVVYDGWYGSVHTFYFSCPRFTSHFQAANAKKLLG